MPALESASVVLRLLAGCWLLWRVPRLGPATGRRPPAAVVVPARDEAATLPSLLASLGPQLGVDDELVVVDDHSGDSTAAVAAGAGARVLRSEPLPSGWTGKAWACRTGAGATGAAVLVFLDADVTLADGGLATVLAEHGRTGGLLSVQPYHVTRRPYERLSAFFNVVALMGSGACTPLGDRVTPVGAFGPVLVTSRDDYERVGGHAHPEVRGAVLDDVALAHRYRSMGLPLRVRGGRGTASFRMYPAGVASLVEGWSKNIAGGARVTGFGALVLVVAWLSLAIEASWWVATLAFAGDGPGTGPWFALSAYLAVVVQLGWMLRRVGRFGAATPALFPVPLLFFFVVFARSAAATVVRGRVRWKGRTIDVGRRRRPDLAP